MFSNKNAPAATGVNDLNVYPDYNLDNAKAQAENKYTLLTVQQFVTEYPAFTVGGMRSYIFYEDINGLKTSGAIKRIGRKILIDVNLFFEWVATNPSPKGGQND
ncbi:MAG: hypothetical protein ACLRFJ_02040 [Alphaproteobacteria bacterium]